MGVILLGSCLKDHGNYDYKNGTYIRILHPTYSYSTFLNDTLTVLATRQFKGVSSEDSLKFDDAWFINGEFYSDEPVLKYIGKEIGSFSGKYYAVDKETGAYTAAASGFTINVTSPFSTGWAILYDKGGKSELGHVRIAAGIYYDYIDLYKSANKGEEMGSEPTGINGFAVTGGKRGLFVLQNGGQGSIELSGDDYKRQLVTRNSFAGPEPANFKPVDIGLFQTSDIIVNENGDIYPRYFNNPIPFTTPWLTLPMQVNKGMKIKEIWNSWSNAMTYAFMYDKLNNRILQIRLDAPNVTGGIAAIDTFPNPVVGTGIIVPDDYVNPNRLGNWEYVWGGTFHDRQYAGDGAMLIKDPSDQKIYLETFLGKSANRVFEWSPQFKMFFPGTSVVNQNSKYVALKSRDYLFFTGGANNSDLYYFDILSKTIIKLFKSHTSQINVLTVSDDDNEMAVGLADGTFILYDVSNQAIINGTPTELHRLSGLGKVVDIVRKGSQMN